MHHSLTYACPPETAQPLVEALVRKSGPGPYNQKDVRMLCQAYYLVSPLQHCDCSIPTQPSMTVAHVFSARQVGSAPAEPTYSFPDGTGLPFGKGKCMRCRAACNHASLPLAGSRASAALVTPPLPAATIHCRQLRMASN